MCAWRTRPYTLLTDKFIIIINHSTHTSDYTTMCGDFLLLFILLVIFHARFVFFGRVNDTGLNECVRMKQMPSTCSATRKIIIYSFRDFTFHFCEIEHIWPFLRQHSFNKGKWTTIAEELCFIDDTFIERKGKEHLRMHGGNKSVFVIIFIRLINTLCH